VIDVQNGDGFVIMLIVAGLFVWLILSLKGRKRFSSSAQIVPLDIPVEEDEVPDNDETELLREAGYHILSGKQRLPITIVLDNQEELQSRLFIDYFVQKEGELYVVKTARDRKPMELTGSGIRDHLLSYRLAYPQAAGVLYIDMGYRKITTVKIEIGD
jgi:hypothetical protein